MRLLDQYVLGIYQPTSLQMIEKNNIRKIMQRDAKYKNYFSREKYVKARNRCNRVCSGRRHIHKSVVKEDNTEKDWSFLRILGVGKAKHQSLLYKFKQIKQTFLIF